MILEIMKNKGGNIHNGELKDYTQGYMVGVSTIEIVNTVEFTARFQRYVELSKYMNVGFWFEPIINKWFVDFSENIKRRDVAELLARERGELAIWDCKNSQEIRIK